MHNVLVLGGYGFFGSRICAMLAKEEKVRLLIGGRDGAKAKLLADALGVATPVSLDANADDFSRRLADLRVDALIHTAGPFQHQDYRVARAAIEAGCHYIDLADGRDFVAGIDSLDTLAKSRGVSVISGASTAPALTSAVVDRYLPRFDKLTSIEMAVSTGARTPGLATIEGVFDYCGKPTRRWEDGKWKVTYGWLDLIRYRFPSPLGARLLGSCDIPDLQLFPKRYPTVETVKFHAGFASSIGHLTVWALAGLVKLGALRSAQPFAAPLDRAGKWAEPFVSGRGGMFVKLKGIGHDGRNLCIAWHLLASQNHGPNIPCGASIALIQKRMSGAIFPPGARACIGILTPEEYLAPLQNFAIQVVADE